MRNKQLVHKKLERVDSALLNLQRMVRMGESKSEFQHQLEEVKEIVEEITYMIEEQEGL
jgi:K+-sensing histidine kinase KdpD